MTPFHFGDRMRRLFGVYDPAETARAGQPRAVVFCAPWGPEYMASHGALRRLALQLAAAGQHVLRFDYFGTGDSEGEIEDGDLDGWRDDIATAIDEVREMSGASKVGLVGLRLGATLGAEIAADRSDVDRLALWEPVVAGPSYLAELQASHEAWVRERTRYVPLPDSPTPNRMGHPLSPALERQIASLDLGRVAGDLRQKVLVVASGSALSTEHMADVLRRIDPERLARAEVDDLPFWSPGVVALGGPLPSNGYKRIAEWLA